MHFLSPSRQRQSTEARSVIVFSDYFELLKCSVCVCHDYLRYSQVFVSDPAAVAASGVTSVWASHSASPHSHAQQVTTRLLVFSTFNLIIII